MRVDDREAMWIWSLRPSGGDVALEVFFIEAQK